MKPEEVSRGRFELTIISHKSENNRVFPLQKRCLRGRLNTKLVYLMGKT